MAITSIKSSRDFVRIWFFWKKPAILVFFLIVISIFLYSFTSTPMYKSTAKIMVLPRPDSELVISPGQDSRQYLSRAVSNQDINTEIELIKSEVVLMNTVKFYQPADSAPKQVGEKPGKFNILDWLKFTKTPLTDAEKKTKALLGSLSVEPMLSSNLISISLESPYQNQVAEVLNKLLEIYMKYQKQTFSLGDTELFYDDQKDYYAEELAVAKKKLKDYSSQWNIVNMKGQISSNLGLISTFNEQLQNLEITIAENQAKIDMLDKGLKTNGGKFTISKEMRSLPVIAELARGLVPLLIKRTEISKTFTKQSREFKQIDDQIAMLRQEILNETLSAARTDTVENETLRKRKDALAKKLEILKQQSIEFQQKKEEHGALGLEVEIARNNFLKYGAKKEDSRLFSQRNESNLSNVVITEKAIRPSRAYSPNTLLALQVAIFLGLFAALILPFILETMDQKLKTSDDIEDFTSLPVVCTYNEIT